MFFFSLESYFLPKLIFRYFYFTLIFLIKISHKLKNDKIKKTVFLKK
jgi:hypothetical protein